MGGRGEMRHYREMGRQGEAMHAFIALLTKAWHGILSFETTLVEVIVLCLEAPLPPASLWCVVQVDNIAEFLSHPSRFGSKVGK